MNKSVWQDGVSFQKFGKLEEDKKTDILIIGGGMAYTFVKANGGKIGSSICEDDQMEVALAIQKKAQEKGVSMDDSELLSQFCGNVDKSVVGKFLSTGIRIHWSGIYGTD